MSRFGYHGKLLEVNLSEMKVQKLPLDETDAKLFVGGR